MTDQMRTITLPFDDISEQYRSQVEYALSFAAEGLERFELTSEGSLRLFLKEGADRADIVDKVERLLARYANETFGSREVVHFSRQRDLEPFDAYEQMKADRWITEVGPGHVILRGPAARLVRCVEGKVHAEFAVPMGAETEVYPQTIRASSLDRIAHFSSFPEHVDFVSHLREDVDLLGRFAEKCREQGWHPSHHDGQMAPIDLAICPSCCYHCYEGMEGWELDRPGRTITALLNCHRYEAGNLSTMSRLRSFHMREIIWVGHPRFVQESRSAADGIITQWANDWELACTYENANDMFFTDDYAVKASFQRQQEAKRELRLTIPFETRAISCTSSNFHAVTFGKAWNITVDGRPAASGCVGWGLERWVYAVVSQFGLDEGAWPPGLRRDLELYAPTEKK